jgi:hypothetical protein
MYSFIQDVPTNAEMYGKVREELRPDLPPGLLVHLAIQTDTGLRYIDVWEQESDFASFRDSRLVPVLRKVLGSYGIDVDAGDAVQEEIDVIDAWLATEPAHAR